MGANRKTTEDEIAVLKEATREAHEAIRGLREVMRDARRVLPELKDAAQRHVDEFIEPIVKSEVEKMTAVIDRAIESADKRVNARFDQLADIMLGEDKKSRRKGEPSLTDLAKQKVERQSRGSGN